MRERRRLAAFAVVCAVVVGGCVWWAVGDVAPNEIAPTTDPAAAQPTDGQTPRVSEPLAKVPTLPAGWVYVQNAEIPVADAGVPQLPASGTDSRGEAVEITDVDRVMVGGDDVIEIMDSIGMYESVYAAPEETTLVTGRDAAEHFTFNKDTGPEGILEVKASLFFGNSLRRHTKVVEALAKTKMPAVIVEQNQPAPAKIRLVSTLLGRPDAGEQLATAVEKQLAEAATIAKQRGGAAPRVLHVAVGGGGRATAVGAKTPPHDVIVAAGGINVAAEAGLELYADMNNEGLLASRPDVILVTVADLVTWGGAAELWKTWPTLRSTPAGKANRVLVMPDSQLSGGSVATGAGTLDLATALGTLKQ